MFKLSLIWTAILLEHFCVHCQLIPKSIDGSLSDLWNLNATLYTNDLQGNILYFLDHNLNNLLITIAKFSNNTKYIHIRYNNEMKTRSLKSLCGCDPCEKRTLNLYLASLSQVIQVTCNHYDHDRVTRIDIRNRVNNRVPNSIKHLIDKENTIYVSIPFEKSGCLQSLYHNGRQIRFEKKGNHFLPSCPQFCSKDFCNKGQCRSLYSPDAICDCSSTALSGPYCNNSLVTYRQGSNNSYVKLSTSNIINIKLAWKPKSLDKKYCLLNFVNEYGQVTLSSYQNFVLSGAEMIATITDNQINFIVVNVTDQSVTIKINDKVTSARPALIGKMTINVGYVENNDNCLILEGQYYFDFDSSQLRAVSRLKFDHRIANSKSPITNTFYISIILICFGLTLIFVLLVAVYFSMNRKKPISSFVPDVEVKDEIELSSDGCYDKIIDGNSYEDMSEETEYLEPRRIRTSQIN